MHIILSFLDKLRVLEKINIICKVLFQTYITLRSPAEGLPLELVVWSDDLETRLALTVYVDVTPIRNGNLSLNRTYRLTATSFRYSVFPVLFNADGLVSVLFQQYINKILTNKCVKR